MRQRSAALLHSEDEARGAPRAYRNGQACLNSGETVRLATPSYKISRNDENGALALAELVMLAGAGLTILLALFHTRVTSQDAGLFQRRPKLGIELEQGARDAVTDRPSLARLPSATNLDPKVDLLLILRMPKREKDRGAMGITRKVVVDGSTVDLDLAAAGREVNTSH